MLRGCFVAVGEVRLRREQCVADPRYKVDGVPQIP